MKKTLIAAAVAAAVAAPAANAGVEIYGKIHVSIDYSDVSASLRACDVTGNCISESGEVYNGWDVNSRASRIGFKGTEDLGNGLKAIWRLENTVRITDTGSTPWSHDGKAGHWGSARNAYIGLAGDWGTFLYGRHDTPYKMAFYSTGIDMLGDSVIDANRLYGITEVRADDAIAYVSPNWNGLTFAGAIVPGEGYTDSVTGENFDGIADNYSIGVMYSNNGLKLAVGYEVLDQGLPATAGDGLCAVPSATSPTGATGGDCTNMLIGGGYSMNNFDISAVYIQQEYGIADSDVWALSAAYSFGNNKVIATYGQNDLDLNIPGVSNKEEVESFGIALQHMFSKRTSAYLAYANSSLDVNASDATGSISGNVDEDVFSFGMIHNF
jgi:predicted porin